MRIPTKLWNKDFFLLWQGHIVSQIGSKAFVVGMMLWVQEATGSALLVGSLLMVATLPSVLIGPFAGALADRYSRRAIIVISDLVSGLCSLVVAALFVYSPDATRLLLIALFGVALINGIARAFFRPSVAAAVPDLVPHHKIMAANSLRQAASRLSAVLGQGTGGMIYAWFGAPLLFAIDTVSYLFSAASECFIRLPSHKRQHDSKTGALRRVWRDSMEGLRYVWGYSGMRNLLLIEASANFFMMPMVVLLPFYVAHNLGEGPEWYGWLLAAMSVGGLVGFSLAGFVTPQGRGRAIVILLTCAGGQALLGSLAFIETPLAALCSVVLVGVMVGLFNVQTVTTFQTASSAEFRGRVMGMLGTASMAAAPLGMFLGGLAGDLTGQNISLVYTSAGLLGVLSTLILGLQRPVLRFLEAGSEQGGRAWPDTAAQAPE